MKKVADDFISTQWANWCNPEESLRDSLHREIPYYNPKVALFEKCIWKIDYADRKILALPKLCTYESDRENFCDMNRWVEFLGYCKFELDYDLMEHPLFGFAYFKTLVNKALAVAEGAMEAQFEKACNEDQAAFVGGTLSESRFDPFNRFPPVAPNLDFKRFVAQHFSYRAYYLLEIKLGDDAALAKAFFRLHNWANLSKSLSQTSFYPLHLHPSLGLATLETWLKEFIELKVKALLEVYLGTNERHPYLHGDDYRRLIKSDDDRETFHKALRAKRPNPRFIESHNKMLKINAFINQVHQDHGFYNLDPVLKQILEQALTDCKLSLAPKRDRSPHRRSTRLKK